jgi:hypothetical protein
MYNPISLLAFYYYETLVSGEETWTYTNLHLAEPDRATLLARIGRIIAGGESVDHRIPSANSDR